MAENLKPRDDENERKENSKHEPMDSKLKNIKDLIVEEALKYAKEDEADLQKVIFTFPLVQ